METCSSMLEPLSQDFIHFRKKSFLIALFTWNEAACLFLTFVLPSLSTDTDDIDDKNMTWQSHSLTAAAYPLLLLQKCFPTKNHRLRIFDLRFSDGRSTFCTCFKHIHHFGVKWFWISKRFFYSEEDEGSYDETKILLFSVSQRKRENHSVIWFAQIRIRQIHAIVNENGTTLVYKWIFKLEKLT